MQNPTTIHSYVKLNNSSVHLVQYGGPNDKNIVRSNGGSANGLSSSSSSSSNNSTTKRRNLIIFIPGNPGMLGVYHDYLCSLYRTICHPSNRGGKLGQPIILAIGHNNFDHPDTGSSSDPKTAEAKHIVIDDNDLNFVEKSLVKDHYYEPHNIELQVINKLIILKRLVLNPLDNINNNNYNDATSDLPDNVIFIGHSIGCYVILRLLQDKQLGQIHHKGSILLHPALENLALTKKGSITSACFTYKLDLIMKAVALVLDTMLPKSAKINLVKWASSPDFVEASSLVVLDSMSQLINTTSLGALIELAKSEFGQVKSLDHRQMIEPHLKRLRLIYAQTDHWVNKEHREHLRSLYGDRISIEEEPTMHAFIMDPPTVSHYAVKVGMLIEDLIEEGDDDNDDQYDGKETRNSSILSEES